MPIRLLPTMAKNDHDYPATRILANGHTLVIASEGNNRIGMILFIPQEDNAYQIHAPKAFLGASLSKAQKRTFVLRVCFGVKPVRDDR